MLDNKCRTGPRRLLPWLLGLLLLAVGAGLFGNWEMARLRPQIAAAVLRATGRHLVLRGAVRLRLLPLGISASDVTLDGQGAEAALHVAVLRASPAFWPLLHGEIRLTQLELVRPVFAFVTGAKNGNETDAKPPLGERATAEARPSLAQAARRTSPEIRSLRIRGGTLLWRDADSGQQQIVTLDDLQLDEATPDAPITVAGTLLYRGQTIGLNGRFGALQRAQDRAARSPWPLWLSLTAGNAGLVLDGFATDPARGRGYRVTLTAASPTLAELAPMLPPAWAQAGVPGLQDIGFAATLADGGDGRPVVSTIMLHVGATALAGPRLRLLRLDLTGARLDTPMLLDLAATIGVQPLTLTGRLDPPGADLFAQGLALRGLILTLPHADLAGRLSLRLAPRPAIEAQLTSRRIDLDALREAWSPPLAKPAAAPPGATPPPAAPPTPPLPRALLTRGDADVDLAIDRLSVAGQTLRQVRTHLTLRQGRLRLAPLQAETAAGAVALDADLDAAQPVPPLAVSLHAPALAIQPLLAAFGLPGHSDGTLELASDLHAAGETAPALMASLQGGLGLALVDGQIDNRALAAALASLLRGTKLPLGLLGGGESHVRCLALRFDATKGVATLRAARLDADVLQLTAEGSLDLAARTVALELYPELRLGGAEVRVPTRLSGPWGAPRTQFGRDAEATLPANAHCATALPLARFGQSGSLPPPAERPKGLSLKSLLDQLRR